MTERVESGSVFARRLCQARKRLGLSQKQLGILAGLDPAVASPRINQYERGKHEPQLATAKKLADALGVPPAFLFTDDQLLSDVLLRWNRLTAEQKKEILEIAEQADFEPTAPRGQARDG